MVLTPTAAVTEDGPKTLTSPVVVKADSNVLLVGAIFIL